VATSTALLSRANPNEAAPDGFERRLLEARSLIDSTVTAYRSLSAQRGRDDTGSDRETSESPVLTLVGGARQRVSATLSGDADQATEIATALVRRSRVGGRSVAVRLLCAPRALGTPLVRHIVPRVPNCEVRVTDVKLDEALMMDGRAAVVRAPQEDDVNGRVMEDPAAARTLELLFACVWRGAVLLDEYERLDGRLHTDMGQRILEHLYAGRTDAVAAQEMNVSLRTYRRHVAEIMRDLGVNSRFQAGVRAAELRLLPECGQQVL
jgi:DNA-binding NarL/FixJ family response regulator